MLIILYIFRVAQKAFGLYTTLTMLYVYRKKNRYILTYTAHAQTLLHICLTGKILAMLKTASGS